MTMKSWYVTVIEKPCNQIVCRKCISAFSATEVYNLMKTKYKDILPDPLSTDPRLQKGVSYSIIRDQY